MEKENIAVSLHVGIIGIDSANFSESSKTGDNPGFGQDF